MAAAVPCRRSSSRNHLISEHVEVARRISLRMARRCPDWVSREDLIAAGLLGLTEAAARYDGARREPFLAFAEKRIRGAVLDEMRRGDIMPRRVRRMARRIAETIAQLERELGTAPDAQAIALALGVTVEEYERDLAGLVHVTVHPSETEHELAAPPETDSPADQAERRLAMGRVRDAMSRLEARDIQLLAFHYENELTYSETGERMGVTTSRVCQLHGRAIERLRTAIGVTAPAQG
jgi:RNA polymerase sigma factor for flagellar operon FliA